MIQGRSEYGPNAMTYKSGRYRYIVPDLVRKEKELKKKARSITNTDIEAVFAAEYFAFYKGTPVIRINSSNGGSFAIMGFIFLNHSYDKYDNVTQEQLLNHEYGHILQQKELGHDKYIIAVAIPSVTFFSLQGNNDWIVENYYNLPWEYDADIRGIFCTAR